MSLINQVLKEVEKRRNSSRSSSQHEAANFFARSEEDSYFNWRVFVMIVIAGILAGSIVWWWHVRSKHFHAPATPYQLTAKQTVALKKWHDIAGTKSTRQLSSFMQKVAIPITTKQIYEEEYQQAVNSIQQGNLLQATNQLVTLVNKDPSYLKAREQLVALLLKQGRVMEAYRWLVPGLKQTPSYLPFVQLDARILLLQGHVHRALAVLQTISPPITQDPSYYVLLADVQRELGNNATAIAIYEKLLSFDSSNSYWWMGLGICFEQEKNYNLAINAYNQALTTGSLNFNLVSFVQARLRILQRGQIS